MSPGDSNIERYKEEEKPEREIKKKQSMTREESWENVLKHQIFLREGNGHLCEMLLNI